MTRTTTGRKAREQRQEDAQARQEAREARSVQEQVEALDKRLGAGVGAQRERARLTGAQPTGKTKVSRQKREKRGRA